MVFCTLNSAVRGEFDIVAFNLPGMATLLYPYTLKISSITSISRVTSTRYEGMDNPKPASEIEFTLMSNEANIFLMVSGFISSPIMRFTFWK